MPQLTVLCGGGGVGKTSTSAALGMALAREGRRTLVVTIDPARRLADALGVSIGAEACPVTGNDLRDGTLFVRMPEAKTMARDFLVWLFEDPGARARIERNGAWRALSDAIAGTHELLALSLVERDLQSGAYEHVVLDTAPSRHALDFLTYPKRLLDLLDAKALKWIADIATSRSSTRPPDPAARPSIRPASLVPPGGSLRPGAPRASIAPPARTWGSRKGRLLSWGRGQVESLLGRALGRDAVVSVAELLGEVSYVRKRWAEVIRAAYNRLLGGGARFVLVGAPTGAAVEDVVYLGARLRQLGSRASAVVLNRADVSPPEAFARLAGQLDASSEHQTVRRTIERLETEYRNRARLSDEAEAHLRQRLDGSTPLLRLPLVVGTEPVQVVRRLALELGPLTRLVDTPR